VVKNGIAAYDYSTPELWEKRSQLPPPVKEKHTIKDHSYNKWTRVRTHQDPYLKTEKQKRRTHPHSHKRN
jgi:hypothetical protein